MNQLGYYDMSWPSIKWLHRRVEDQALVNKLCMYLRSVFVNEGYDSVAPALDERYWSEHFISYKQLIGKACCLCVRA